MGLEELQKIYINPWYSLFNSPSARQMAENFPSKLFFLKDMFIVWSICFAAKTSIIPQENKY